MSWESGVIKVVSGVICNAQREILVALRPKHVPQGNLWELPGGKVEPAETELDALIRELREEIGITVTQAHSFAHITHNYPERTVDLAVWWVDAFTGEPHGMEGQEVRWVTPAVLEALDIPDANRPILEKIRIYLSK